MISVRHLIATAHTTNQAAADKQAWSLLPITSSVLHARTLNAFTQYSPHLYTGLFEKIVGVLTACHTQYTRDSSICIFYLIEQHSNFVTYLTVALYVHPLWFYKHQHDNPVRSKLFVACQRWWFLLHTHTLSLETVHTIFEWNCQMVVLYRIWCGIAAGQL